MDYIRSRKHLPTRKPACSHHLGTATLAAGLVLALPVMADTTNATALPMVKVQATRAADYRVDNLSSPKFTQPVLDTPQTVQIIGRDLIDQQGARTLTEALRNSPGVGTFYAGENGSTSTGDSVSMRGFDTSGSIFVDGVRDLGSVSRDIFNIEQVEVIKGPAGTDYGRTAPTGSINLVTKQPTRRDAVSASASYGSGPQRRITTDWNQTLSATAAFRLNLFGHDDQVAGRDAVRDKRWGIAPSLAFGLGTPARVYLDYLHVRQDNVPDGAVPTIGLPGYSSPDPARPQIGDAPRVDPENFYGTDADHDDVDADMATLRIEHDASADARLVNTTRWGRTHQDYLLTSYMLSDTRLVTPDLDDPSTWAVQRSIPTFKDQTDRILTNQTAWVATIGTGRVMHVLSAGFELTREKLDTVDHGALDGSAWPDANLYTPDRHVSGLIQGRTGAGSHGTTDTAGAYLFDTMKLGTQWQITAGARLDRYDTDFDSIDLCGGRRGPDCGSLPDGSPVPGVDASSSGNLPAWKLGVLYKPAAHGSLYANFATSQQPPGGKALELSLRDNNANNPVFDPQKARTTEIGSKWDLLDERLLLTGALYRTIVSNEVEQDPVDQLYHQTGRKRVQGLELNAVGRLSDNWSVSAGFTTTDAKVLEGRNVSQDGSRDLAYTPDRAFTAWTSYRLASGLTLGGGARYNGALKRGTDGAVGTPTHTDSYWVFDAVASYPVTRHVSVQLNVYNLFDQDYVAAINKSGYRYAPGTPRSVRLTANVRF